MLDKVTEYVFEILQNSNFSQEIHESFLDIALRKNWWYAYDADPAKTFYLQGMSISKWIGLVQRESVDPDHLR